ncbi:MAG: formate dehydrogenase accessory sulfurtransferase FdhD [Bacillota bacterium]
MTSIRRIYRFTAGKWEELADMIALETRLSIHLDGELLQTIYFLPSDPELLVLGYLFHAGLIESGDEVESFAFDPDQNRAWVKRRAPEVKAAGVPAPPEAGTPALSPATVRRLADALAGNRLFRQTGAVHCGLLAREDAVLFSTEDTGRLNVLDKLTGFLLRERLVPGELILAFSGRLTAQVVNRVTRMGIPVVVSPAAPTSEGLGIAAAQGITLAGFTRGERFNVYTHPERLIVNPARG